MFLIIECRDYLSYNLLVIVLWLINLKCYHTKLLKLFITMT